MKKPNPFLYSSDPYRENPFTVLGVPPDVSQASIDQFAESREQLLNAGEQPAPELELRAGDCKRAAQHLQDPLLRLAFDLMTHAEIRAEEQQ